MAFIFHNILSKNEYYKFWNEYKNRYFMLKSRYMESYQLENDF
jgi:hypothetical protein